MDPALIAAATGVAALLFGVYRAAWPEKKALVISEEQGAHVILKGLNDAQGNMIAALRADMAEKDKTIARLRAELDADFARAEGRMSEDYGTDVDHKVTSDDIRKARHVEDKAEHQRRSDVRAAEVEEQKDRDQGQRDNEIA